LAICDFVRVPGWLKITNHQLQFTNPISMYHYNPTTALEELKEEAVLPNPVHVRDMMLRAKLSPDRSLEMNRLFLDYQRQFGELQKLGKELLGHLAKD
jgi:hypothetical protein